MTTPVGKFADLQNQVPGYFRDGGEEQFPWHARGKGVWYALFVLEEGRIQRYGFTSSMTQKGLLRETLTRLDNHEATLLGVWQGEFGTHLFDLHIPTAIKRLE